MKREKRERERKREYAKIPAIDDLGVQFTLELKYYSNYYIHKRLIVNINI